MVTLFLITRPWSFPMTLISVGFGILYALWIKGVADVLSSLLALAGAVLLHAMVNLLNDYFDYRFGVDRPGVGTVAYRPHPIVHGVLSPSGVAVYGFGLGVAALAIGAIIAALSKPLVLLFGGIGFLLAYAYTGPPFKLKYVGLGEPTVFAVWGPLMALGGYYVASGSLDLSVVLASTPLGMLVAAVLLANNLRDIDSDREVGVKTLAVILGRRRATTLYQVLIMGGPALTALLAVIGYLPPLSIAVLALMPKALSLARIMENPPPDADPRTAQLVLAYGLVVLASLGLQTVIS